MFAEGRAGWNRAVLTTAGWSAIGTKQEDIAVQHSFRY
jgi:hypothetical protein